MATTDISSNGLTISILAIPLIPTPLEITHLSADGDVWSVEDIDTADAQMTPDGETVTWGINAMIGATLTLSGASPQGKRLANLLKGQRKYGTIPATINNVTVTVYNSLTDETETFLDGIMSGGSPAQSYGNQKKNDRVFKFKFSERV